MKTRIGVAGLGSILLLTACTAGEHLIYVQEASLGLSIGLGTEGTEKVSLGYDRDVLAIVPPARKDDGDAMSLLSVNRAEVRGLGDLDVAEFVSTGDPASELAARPAAVESIRRKIYGE